MPIRLSQAGASEVILTQGYLNEFVFRFNRRFWPMVAFDSVLNIAARTEALTYRDPYEGAHVDTNFAQSDEPASTG